jgi:hypothetical protein
MKISHSNIVSAFSPSAIGAKVVDAGAFNLLLEEAISGHDFSTGSTPGQAVIELRGDFSCVSSGDGRRSADPGDYVCRLYRGRVQMFLRRSLASPVASLRAVVYTKEGYLRDPDVVAEPPEAERILRENPTHVLVAVLATSAPSSFVSPYRFVANLAGGNLDYQEGRKTYADLVELARNVKQFDDEWAVVAD